MIRLFLATALALAAGCGPTHRISYQMPSREPGDWQTTSVHHGIGLVGGGLLYNAFSQMLPRVVRYEGAVRLLEYCPEGVAEVRQFHSAEANLYSGVISWLIIVDPYHETDIEIRCAKDALSLPH